MYGESLKIQLGSIAMNRTRKYLFPIIKAYGTDFTKVIDSMFKVAVGIGDIVVQKCGLKHEKHLFILVNVKQTTSVVFATLLNWLKEHHAYEDDYSFDDIQSGIFHMIVIKVPDTYIDSLDKFKNSEFSKMYTHEDIKNLFTYSGSNTEQARIYQDIKKILIHDHSYRIEFAKCIEKEFNIPKYSPRNIPEDSEYDLPILTQEEFFNLDKGAE